MLAALGGWILLRRELARGPGNPWQGRTSGRPRRARRRRHAIGGLAFHWLAERGSSILLFAEDEASDLLVLSTRNRGVVERALLGSVSAEVTRVAPCSVLLIPPQPK